MQRREFCKLVAATVAATAVPTAMRADEAGETGRGTAAATRPAPGFNALTQDYAQFCAMPADKRTFYALKGNKIISEKWAECMKFVPPKWGEPPALPVPGGSWDGVPMVSPIPGLAGNGPYQPTWDSLLQYEAPEWYQDAKFGIWAHWSPQSVPEVGDWYAQNMYREKGFEDQASMEKFHTEHYGHPSRFGYKELCAQWTLLDWQPDELVARYKKAGAKFIFALANHHDGFDAWDSKHHPWNAVNMGPRRDVVGHWAKAARDQGLRFGVTVHQARNWWWFQVAHGADATGPLAGRSL